MSVDSWDLRALADSILEVIDELGRCEGGVQDHAASHLLTALALVEKGQRDCEKEEES